MNAIEIDTTRLPLLLHELRLPAIARLWPEFVERADKDGWPAARLLSALAELELAEPDPDGRRWRARATTLAGLRPGFLRTTRCDTSAPMMSTREITLETPWLGKPGTKRYRIIYRDGVPVAIDCFYNFRQGQSVRRVWSEGQPQTMHIVCVLERAT